MLSTCSRSKIKTHLYLNLLKIRNWFLTSIHLYSFGFSTAFSDAGIKRKQKGSKEATARFSSRFTRKVKAFNRALAILQWFDSGLILLLQWFYIGFTVILQWFYSSGFTVVLKWFYSGLKVA